MTEERALDLDCVSSAEEQQKPDFSSFREPESSLGWTDRLSFVDGRLEENNSMSQKAKRLRIPHLCWRCTTTVTVASFVFVCKLPKASRSDFHFVVKIIILFTVLART